MQKISRRQFVKLSVVAVAGLTTGCSSAPAVPAADATASTAVAVVPTTAVAATVAAPAPATITSTTAVGRYREAPMLAALVQAGKLPSVDERLPKQPWVVPLTDGVGKYGGAIHGGYRGQTEGSIGWWMQEDLLYYDKDLNLKPNLCESWTVNDAGTEYTFKLRDGIKWSDGQPLTSADYVWWQEYFVTDPDLNPNGLEEYRTTSPDGATELVKCDAPDPLTVKYTFARTKALFPHSVSRFRYVAFVPAHYMKQFHMRATDDKAKLAAMVKEAKVESWKALYLDRANNYLNPKLPQLTSWLPVAGMPQDLFILQRNPYFYGVDSAGNQLPYIDKHQYRYYDQEQTHSTWILNGEEDIWPVDVDTAASLKQNEERAKMRFVRWQESSIYAVEINLATKNARLRELYNKREFRLALMHAVNRDEMNKLVFDGEGTPMQVAPVEGSPQFSKVAAFSHIEYKPDYANQLLDGLGLTKRNAEGYRVWSDGSNEPVGFILEMTDESLKVKFDELAIKYWKDVGLKVTLNLVQRTQYFADTSTNNLEAGGWDPGETYTVWKNPKLFIGTQLDKPWCPGFGLYRLNPKDPNAVKPPEGHFIWNLWKLWDQCEVEPDDAKRTQIFLKMMDIWAEEVPIIGFLTGPAKYIALKQGLKGLPEKTFLNWGTGYFAQHMCEQYWWDEPESHV